MIIDNAYEDIETLKESLAIKKDKREISDLHRKWFWFITAIIYGGIDLILRKENCK